MTSRLRMRDEQGIALLTVILVGAVVMVLGMTAVTVSGKNLSGAGRDRVGGAALAAAEAGLSQGMEFIKQGSISNPPCSTACNVGLPDGRAATVTVSVVQPYSPPQYRVATFKIVSVGSAGSGPGQRTLEATVTAKPFGFPIGIFTESLTNMGGHGDVVTESLFSDSCIDSRSKITFSGTDSFYGFPAAAHSTTYINDKQDTGCGNGVGSSIHATQKCSTAYPGDQDGGAATVSGGAPASLAGTSCNGQTASNSSNYTHAQLIADTGFTDNGLTPGQYAQLQALAKAQHHYAPAADFVWPCYSTCPAGQAPELNPVVFYNGSVNPPGLADYAWQTPNASCTNPQPSLVFVVRNGDLTLNGGSNVTGNFFVPDGDLKANGGVTLHGTAFASTLKFTGGAYSELHACQLKNFPSPLTDVQISRFHEKDR